MTIPLWVFDPRVTGRRQSDANDAARLMHQADEIEARRTDVIRIAKYISDECTLSPRVLLSLQIAVEMLKKAESETTL